MEGKNGYKLVYRDGTDIRRAFFLYIKMRYGQHVVYINDALEKRQEKITKRNVG